MVGTPNSDEQQVEQSIENDNFNDLKRLLDELEEKNPELLKEISENAKKICSDAEIYLKSGLF